MAGFIIYKKFITKKQVIVSGVNMTDTPRMSRKGSYKGVVGGSRAEVRQGGGVDVEEDEEVLGEVEEDGEEETGLSRRDDEEEDGDEEEEEDEEEEVELTDNRQQRQPRRPV